MQNLKPGSTLRGGTYKIVRFIASGGFGCTYEARHTLLDSRVAIKEFFVKDFCNRGDDTAQITVGTLSKKGLVDRLRKKFVDEAKALHSLHHPGIVSVTDIFEENGTSYYVMDYIDGQSLSAMVNQGGPLSEAKALKYIRQVADALRYVHEHNRLHLDIKPANIMVDANDNAILIDFGASKQYDEVNGENTSTLMGKTPGYAPLEQMGNDVVQFFPSTDIYALGATLYKLLTGVTPLSANMLAAGEGLKPLPSNISKKTSDAIDHAMTLQRSRRPQSIDEFIAYLPVEGAVAEVKPRSAAAEISVSPADDDATQLTSGPGAPTPPASPRKPAAPVTPLQLPTEDEDDNGGGGKKWLAGVIAAVVAAAACVGGYFAYQKWFTSPDVRSIDIEKEFDLDIAKGFGTYDAPATAPEASGDYNYGYDSSYNVYSDSTYSDPYYYAPVDSVAPEASNYAYYE